MTDSYIPTAADFLNAVLSLHPRLAAFDCDGTLWSGDVGETFFRWELENAIVPDQVVRWARSRYQDYKAGNVPEEVMCAEMVTMHRGLREDDLQQVANRFFDRFFLDDIFPEMSDLVRRLHSNGCEVWAVSSSNQWLIRAAMRHFDIPNHRILAASSAVENGAITDRVIRVPSGPGKPEAIHSVIGRAPDAAFGNSRWDAEMLAISRHPFAINARPDLEQLARARGWQIYFPHRKDA